jgi:predicted N-acetyltransferase YhbS
MNERVEELAEREQQYFEVIKTAGFVIVGSVVFVCLSLVLHYVAGGLIDLGPNSVVDAFKITGIGGQTHDYSYPDGLQRQSA